MCCKTGLQDISTPDFSPQASTPDISSMKFSISGVEKYKFEAWGIIHGQREKKNKSVDTNMNKSGTLVFGKFLWIFINTKLV